MSDVCPPCTEVCRAWRNTGKCRYGDECKYVHSEGDPIPNPPRGQCFNFSENGTCKFGDRCRYVHGDNDPRFDSDGKRIPSKKSKSARTKTPRRRKSGPPKKIDEVCNNYLKGVCRYGDGCRRTHVGDVEQKPVEKIDEVCMNFQKGRCRFGDMCRRKHVKTNGNEEGKVQVDA